jgi:hypothetical protein
MLATWIKTASTHVCCSFRSQSLYRLLWWLTSVHDHASMTMWSSFNIYNPNHWSSSVLSTASALVLRPEIERRRDHVGDLKFGYDHPTSAALSSPKICIHHWNDWRPYATIAVWLIESFPICKPNYWFYVSRTMASTSIRRLKKSPKQIMLAT